MRKLLTFYLFIMFSLKLSANIINVPDDVATIQGGIVLAVSGDTVLVQPGTYTENINFIGKNIVVGSLYLTTGDSVQIDSTIIDGNNSGTVVVFENGEDSTAILCGFTIINGSTNIASSGGGGVRCFSSNPIILHNYIKNNNIYNPSSGGAGIFCSSANPKIENNIISNNICNTDDDDLFYGAGIYCTNSNPKILSNKIQQNRGNITFDAIVHGGGICLISNSNATIENNIISRNYAATGGGIYSDSYSYPIIKNNTIDNNKLFFGWGSYQGAGIFCHNAEIVGNIIEHNKPNISDDVWGGGIYCDSALIYNNIIRNNIGFGAGILSKYATIKNNEIYSNDSEGSSGGGGIGGGGIIQNNIIYNNSWAGIYCDDPNSRISNNVICNNHGEQGGGIYLKSTVHKFNNNTVCNNYSNLTYPDGVGGVYCTSLNVVNSIIYGNIGGGGAPNQMSESAIITYSNIQGGYEGEGNVDTKPYFINPTETAGLSSDGRASDWSLQDISPCINSGISDTSGLNIPNNDILGNPRIYNGEVYIIDMGAYEYQGERNFPPYLINPLHDVVLSEDFGEYIIADLDTIFHDDENDILNYSVVSKGTVNTQIDISIFSIISINNLSGIDTIFVLATTTAGPSAQDTFIVNVSSQNDAPVISELPNLSFNEDHTLYYPITNWYDFVSDADDEDNELTYNVTSGNHVTAVNLGSEYQFFTEENWFGIDTLYLSVSDGSLSDTENFLVTVNSINDSPQTFTMIYPSIIDTFSTHQSNDTLMNFQWHRSIDVDDEITYKLRLELDFFGVIYHSEYTDIVDTSYSISSYSLDGLLGGLGLTLSPMNWFVESSDGQYSVTSDTGVFVLSREEITSSTNEINLVPIVYYLSQNYPNPFNPVTYIEFSLPENTHVKLSIFNMQGQEIALLVNRYYKIGKYRISWNANSFASGLYLYQMRTKNFSSYKKMLLIK